MHKLDVLCVILSFSLDLVLTIIVLSQCVQFMTVFDTMMILLFFFYYDGLKWMDEIVYKKKE